MVSEVEESVDSGKHDPIFRFDISETEDSYIEVIAHFVKCVSNCCFREANGECPYKSIRSINKFPFLITRTINEEKEVVEGEFSCETESNLFKWRSLKSVCLGTYSVEYVKQSFGDNFGIYWVL